METLSKSFASGPTREKDSRPLPSHSGVVPDSMSMSSYRDYPAHCPFVSTLVHQTPQTRIQYPRCPVSPSKAFPETKSAAILSALRNLQEKIRRLELDKGVEENDTSHRVLPSEHVSQRLLDDQTDTTRMVNDQSHGNQALITHLAAAESRCAKLERQLQHMRRMLRGERVQGTSLHTQEFAKKSDADKQSRAVPDQTRMEKLEKLEEEYLRLRCAQKNAETKILELEGKVQEEEHQRRLMQDKAKLLQRGMEANRILLQSVSPAASKRSKGKMLNSEKPTPRQVTHPEPHYRLNLRDVPFVAGTSAGSSHSVRANVQAVLSLLKQHQPHLCNSCVLLCNSSGTGFQKHPDCSSSSCASEEGLSELLQTLQEELKLMSVEQDKLMLRLENSVSEEKRKGLLREQERLLLKMERKGEQIHKLHKYKSQVKKLQKPSSSRKSGKEVAFSSRGRSVGAKKIPPGEGSKRNLRLLRDMKVLQASLRT
ncbi:Centrosomal protein of 57 kDa [Oryzias melastigma]|uniref:Centrosomal protein of 57 kDa n=1 Tax=Oryzias melastigma TaxID=30732 RepID=A0A834FMC0_ORYME|nr:Centrosomal protein of 57 kDa [Oryzias melastigma]